MASSRDFPAVDCSARAGRAVGHRLASIGRILPFTLALATGPVLGACGSLLPAATASDTVTRSVTVAGATTLDVSTFNGDIDVLPGPDGTVNAQVKRTGEGSSEAAALADAQNIDVALVLQGSTAVLTATYTPSPDRVTGSRGAAATVSVPAGSSVKLVTSNGAVTVRDIAGAVTATTSNGRITVDNAASAVVVEATNGEIIVRGNATGVHARTSNGAVTVDGAGGVVDVRTSNGPIQLTGARDATLDVGTSNGRVTFTGSMAIGTHRLEVSNGPISITLPADASFGIDATTTNAKVKTAFAMTPAGAVTDTELHATVGANPGIRITATTSNGDISVIKGG